MSRFKNKLHFVWFLILTACGTVIGNGIFDPSQPMPASEQRNQVVILDDAFVKTIQSYLESKLRDCGRFYETSTATELAAGRQCILDADKENRPAKYLYSKKNHNGSRFVSFIEVIRNETDPTSIRIYNVSNVTPFEVNEQLECANFVEGELPETACGMYE